VDRKTPLYEEHVRAGARLVPFAGFTMPIQYSGIIDEHRAVRTAMGLFDLSHMGELVIRGERALAGIDRLLTNDISGLEVGQIRYTPMCFPDGGIVDDLLVYRFPDHLMLVVNAANIEKDLAWVREHLRDIEVEDVSTATALIALQGPSAAAFLQRFTPLELSAIPYYHFAIGSLVGQQAIVSRTGYTGEDGFELYLSPEDAPPVWQALLGAGLPEGLKPVGLGARDTLRLEAGYMLYGNDIDQTTSPIEAGLSWTVKFGPDDFIGRSVLEAQKAGGVKRRMVQFEMLDRAIPRPHFPLERERARVGETTSGTFSPTFGRGIGLAYVETPLAKAGTELDVEIRAERHPAQLVRKPMYRREGG
jgi:aminomethyltransferase